MPIMGVCYALQYLDKAALSQSVLLGLEDVEHGGIVCSINPVTRQFLLSNIIRSHSPAINSPGLHPSSTSATYFGHSPAPT